MPRTRVKICGITRNADALLAVELGADALGLIFHPASPRAVKPEQIPALLANISGLVSVVALFVDPAVQEVETVLASGRIHCLQFQGQESPEFCQRFQHPVLKGIAVQDRESLQQQVARYRNVADILLDTYHPQKPGGTGKTFDWTLAQEAVNGGRLAVTLAGGLNAGNVAAAIATVRPFAVDVCSGVEASPGIKSAEKLRSFFAAVNQSNQEARNV